MGSGFNIIYSHITGVDVLGIDVIGLDVLGQDITALIHFITVTRNLF